MIGSDSVFSLVFETVWGNDMKSETTINIDGCGKRQMRLTIECSESVAIVIEERENRNDDFVATTKFNLDTDKMSELYLTLLQGIKQIDHRRFPADREERK